MKKNFLKELILPAFWLFFFIASTKSDVKVNELKNAKNIAPVDIGMKTQESAAGAANSVNKNKEAIFTKAVYLGY